MFFCTHWCSSITMQKPEDKKITKKLPLIYERMEGRITTKLLKASQRFFFFCYSSKQPYNIFIKKMKSVFYIVIKY
jgi:hypothetical protein